ncbi:MAG: hypothetical protein AAFU79_04890, partial [Myxococcota bacterium]
VACGGAEDPASVDPGAPGGTPGVIPDSAEILLTSVALQLKDNVAFINERTTMTIGVTASGTGSSTTALAAIPVMVSFVDPTDPDNPDVGCTSSAFLLDLVGDGQPRTYEQVVWPTSECLTLVDKPVAIKVEVDPAREGGPLTPPLVTGTVNLQASNFGADGRAEVDIDLELEAESSVMVFPPEGVDADAPPVPDAERTPALRVRTVMVLNGRDPYMAPVDPNSIPEELKEADPTIEEQLRFGLPPDQVGTLDDLPGTLRLRFDFSAANDGQTFVPLQIGREGGFVDEVTVTELTPGIANVLAHELFLTDEGAQAIVSEQGAFFGEEMFQVRACFTTDFPQFRGAPAEGECQTIQTLLVTDFEPESGASSAAFDGGRKDKHGSKRISVSASFQTRNRIDIAEGLQASVEGSIDVKGKIGRSFSLSIVKAEASAKVPLTDKASAEGTLDIFGRRVASFFAEEEDDDDDDDDQNNNNQDPEEERKRKQGKVLEALRDLAVSRSQLLVKARFGFGPIGVGFDLHGGGNLGLDINTDMNFDTTEEECRPELPAATASVLQDRQRLEERIARLEQLRDRFRGFLQRLFDRRIADLRKQLGDLPERTVDLAQCLTLKTRFSPNANLTADAFGGIDIFVARAGVEINLIIARVDFPLDTKLSFGRNVEGQVLFHSGVDFGIEFRPLDGTLKLVGSIRGIFRRRSASVTIASFSTGVIRKDLLSISKPAAEVLF